MSTQAEIGYGFVIEYADTEGETGGTVLAEVLEVKPPTGTREKVKIQTNDSTTDAGNQIKGWRDWSDMELRVVYNKTQAAALYALFNSGDSKYFRFVKPDSASTGEFIGFLSEVGDETPLKDKMMNTIKIAVDGEYVFTPGA